MTRTVSGNRSGTTFELHHGKPWIVISYILIENHTLLNLAKNKSKIVSHLFRNNNFRKYVTEGTI